MYKELDVIVLAKDIPEHGLMSGDLGAVVAVYADAIEAEFVTAAGTTQAVLTLPLSAVRPVSNDDVPAVRTTGESSAA